MSAQAFNGQTASSLLLSRSTQLPAILGYQVLKGAFPTASLTFSQTLPTTDMNGSQPLNVTVQSLGGSNGSGTTVRAGGPKFNFHREPDPSHCVCMYTCVCLLEHVCSVRHACRFLCVPSQWLHA